MIKYSLGCKNDHEFEGWFGSSEEFSRLRKQGLVDCPVCGSMDVDKLLMVPAISKKSNARTIENSAQNVSFENEQSEEHNVASAAPNRQSVSPSIPAPQTALAKPELPEMSPQLAEVHEQMLEKVRAFKKHVVENTEDVGDNFGEEARKIHYGEAEPRGISGKSSIDEAVELIEEGIDVVPIPELPEEKN